MHASKASASKLNASKKTAVSLGILKAHEFKMNEALVWLEDMTDTEWIEYKADLVRDFEAAYRDFQPEVAK